MALKILKQHLPLSRQGILKRTRSQSGLCPDCGIPTTTSGSRCHFHAEKIRLAMNTLNARRRSQGIHQKYIKRTK